MVASHPENYFRGIRFVFLSKSCLPRRVSFRDSAMGINWNYSLIMMGSPAESPHGRLCDEEIHVVGK